MKNQQRKIYTRRGDSGTSSLFSGKKIFKNHLRLVCYGEVDELNCWLGYAVSQSADKEINRGLQKIQEELFIVQSSLANPKKTGPQLGQKNIDWLERQCDYFDERNDELKRFILPGGSSLGAILHLGRAVCRRAERNVVTLAKKEKINAFNLKYLNRLSDLLFILARYGNKKAGFNEVNPHYQ